MKQIFVMLAEKAVPHGKGTMPFKWVSGLTEKERKNVKNGGIVFLLINARHYTQSGYKVVRYRGGRWCHREPSPRELAMIKSFFAPEQAY